MDPIVPAWLNNQFLTQCLQKEEGKEKIVVTNSTIDVAVVPRKKYRSCYYRVKVEYRLDEQDEDKHSMSFYMSDMASGIELIEPNFYHKFIPEATKLMNISFIIKNFFSPRYTTIIFEDIKEQGYIKADKVKQLDFDHCCLYVTAAASLHAVSFKVFKQHPELTEIFGSENMFSGDMRSAQFFKPTMINGIRCLSDNMNRMERFKKYSKIVRDSAAHLWEMMVEAHKPCKVLNTINQGDPWIETMRFKYDVDGKVNQVKLMNFKSCRYASPVNDLAYFIWTSANHNVRKNSLEKLYKIYLDTLNSNLEQLQCDERLTFEELKDNLKLLCPLLVYLVASAPYLYDRPAEDVLKLPQQIYENRIGKTYQQFYSNDYCKNCLPLLLEHMETTGVFDYLEQYQLQHTGQ